MQNSFKFIALAFALTSSAHASMTVSVSGAVAHGTYAVGIDSEVQIKMTGVRTEHSGKFLGKLVQPSGDMSKYMILDETDSTIYLSDKNDTTVNSNSLQPILRQYDQIDGTCTGYAIDHFLQSMHWSGMKSFPELKQTLSTEQGRTQLLVESINNYYLATQHRLSINGILNQFGTRFGFKCTKKVFTETGKARDYIETRMKTGLPLIVSFFIGPNMMDSDIAIKDFESGTVVDKRLWIPRKTGERNSGGHTIVAVGEFTAKSKKKILMLDSDWSEPRVWDLESYLGDRTAVEEIEFYACDAT
jgi:hypothetical protein